MSKNILVIGGTGMLGLPVARRLKEDDNKVTIMTSNPDRAQADLGEEFKITFGDVTDPKTLTGALKGHEYVYINLSGKLDPELYKKIEINGTANIAEAAKQCGVEKIGMISGAFSKGVEEGNLYVDIKVKAERALISSGIPYIIMRPSWFFESLPLAIQSGRAGILGHQPYPLSWLAASDYARQVSRAFQEKEALNKCFYNLGPVKLTMLDALTQFCARFYPDLTPTSISFLKARMIAQLPGMGKLKRLIPFFEFSEKTEENADLSEADRLLGPNLTTLEEWFDSYKKPEA